MNRLLRPALHSLVALLLPTTLMAAPAQATQAAQPDAGQTARCISEHLPRGAQVARAADGAYRVVSFGPRGSAARWTVRQTADAVQVTQSGGPAGIARGLKGLCY